MNLREQSDLVHLLESSFPVADWTIDGLHVWPLFRLALTNNFIKAPISRPGPRGIALAKDLAIQVAQLAAARRADTEHEATLGETADAVFLNTGISYIQNRGAYYERFCDPLITRLAAAGHGALMLTPASPLPVPRRTPSRPIFAELLAVRLQATLWARLARPAIHLPGFEALREALGPQAAQAPGRLLLTRQAALVEAYARYFAVILRQARAKVGLVVCYYSFAGQGFVLACRRLGIPSIDIQHGVHGELHRAYGRWDRVPASGYELLPAIFWCWSDTEAAAIERWRAAGSPHRPVVGGNPLLEAWPQVYPDAAADRARLDAEHPVPTGTPRILITLQSLPDISPLIDAIRAGGDRWFWHIRCHPNQGDRPDGLEARLAAEGFQNAEARLGTALPLYSLLPAMSAHVTAYSAVVYEAQALGVPSVVTHKLAADIFADLIAEGNVRYAETGEAIAAAVTDQLSRLDGAGARTAPRLDTGMRELLSLLQEASPQD